MSEGYFQVTLEHSFQLTFEHYFKLIFEYNIQVTFEHKFAGGIFYETDPQGKYDGTKFLVKQSLQIFISTKL